MDPEPDVFAREEEEDILDIGTVLGQYPEMTKRWSKKNYILRKCPWSGWTPLSANVGEKEGFLKSR